MNQCSHDEIYHFWFTVDQWIDVASVVASTIVGGIAVWIALKVQKNEHEWERRKHVIDILERFSTLRTINVVKPDIESIWQSLNALSFAATLWDRKIVDEEYMFDAIGSLYVKQYDDIEAIEIVIWEGFGYPGKYFLEQEERIKKAYDQAKKQMKRKNEVPH